MPFRIKPWHCVGFIMLGLIAFVEISVRNQAMTLEDHTAKMWGFKAEGDKVIQELNALSNEFYATLSPSDRAAMRAGLSDADRELYPTLFDDVTPAQPLDPTWSDRSRKAYCRLDELIKKFAPLISVPISPK